MTSARDLTVRLAALLRREHDAMAEFIVALADFDRRRVWIELGYSSLFYFLVRELGLSKSAAFYRKTAADLIQRFPEIVDLLREGKLCLSSLAEVEKVITPENRADVLPRFFHASKRDAKEVVAKLKPDAAPPLRDVVTAVSRPEPTAPAAVAPAGSPSEALVLTTLPSDLPLTSGSPANLVRANSPTENRGSLPHRHDDADAVEPLTADLRRLHLTVDREFLELLDASRDALSHSDFAASTTDILKRAMKLLLAEHAKKRHGLVAKPRKDAPPPSDPDSDHIPASVKRAVWKRDGGRCQWKLDSGGICGCTSQLEYAHIKARARGGKATIRNLRLLCRFHNQYEARLQLGDAVMNRYTRTRAPAPDPTPARTADLAEQSSLDLGP